MLEAVEGRVLWRPGMDFSGSNYPERTKYLLAIVDVWEDIRTSHRTTQFEFTYRVADRMRYVLSVGVINLTPVTLNLTVDKEIWVVSQNPLWIFDKYLHVVSEPDRKSLKMALITPQEAEDADPEVFDQIYGKILGLRVRYGHLSTELSRRELVQSIHKEYQDFMKPVSFVNNTASEQV